MHIGFIEDTHLHGGTQIWVMEAVQVFLEKGQEVSLLAPEGSWVVERCCDTGAHITTCNALHQRGEVGNSSNSQNRHNCA